MKKKHLPPVVLALDTFVLDLQTRFTSLWESQEYHERSEFSHQALFAKVYRSIQALEDHLTKQLPASSDPGNYLHRLNQVEQDIRELRQIVETNRQMCDGNVTAVLDFVDAHYQRKGRLSDATNNHS